MKKSKEESNKENDVAKPKEDLKSFYGTLLACMVGITTGFFIQHITTHNSAGLTNPYHSYADFIATKFLGPVMLLAIFGIAIAFPSFWWLMNRKKLNDNIIDALFVASIGAFPFFMQNFVACIVQILDKMREGFFEKNLGYMVIYFFAVLGYWGIGKSTYLTGVITNNRVISYFKRKR